MRTRHAGTNHKHLQERLTPPAFIIFYAPPLSLGGGADQKKQITPIRDGTPLRNSNQRTKQQRHQNRGEEVDLEIRRKAGTRLRYELVVMKVTMSARFEIENPGHR